MSAQEDWLVRKASIEFEDKYELDLDGKAYVTYSGGSDPHITVHTINSEEMKEKLPKNFHGYPVRVMEIVKPS